MSGAAPILIMAGGTGGHVFPALALARLLRAAVARGRLAGHARGLEARVVPAENIAIEWLSMSGLRGKGVADPAGRAVQAAARRSGRRWASCAAGGPALVVGFGGFVTGPGGVAAWLMRRPLVIHEQNAIAGYSNRVLAHLARARACARFRMPSRPASRRAWSAIRCAPRSSCSRRRRQRFARREGALRLLVVGGSLGAARLNTVVPFAHRSDVGPRPARAPPGRRTRHRRGARGLRARRA